MAKAKTKKTTKKAPAKKRARNSKGHYVPDDPKTPHNEAYGEKPASKTRWLIPVLVILGVIAVLFITG